MVLWCQLNEDWAVETARQLFMRETTLTNLRRLENSLVREGGLRSCRRDFQSPALS
jgi:hypothetical protein